MNLTREQILALAPDDSSRKAGTGLASPAKWVSKGISEAALWGEAQGSGSKPYQTQVDIQNIAFKCSCPSRKFPCKHGLGLLLFYVGNKGSFTENAEPVWVTEWITKRNERSEKQATKEEKPVDEAARAKRQQARENKVEDGIAELQRWLEDIIRNGMIQLPEKNRPWFETMARRMVDAQATGLAAMIYSLADLNYFKDGWQNDCLQKLVDIYLVMQAYKNSSQLPEEIVQEVRNLIGFTQSQDELKAQTGVTDTWLVLSNHQSVQDNITTDRFWLYGTGTQRTAMILQFTARGQMAQNLLSPGMVINAELVYFPGVTNSRAIVKNMQINQTPVKIEAAPNWLSVLQAETTKAEIFPVQQDRPYVIQNCTPVKINDSWWLVDGENKMLQMKNELPAIYELLALSGGHPVNVAVVGRENLYEPVGAWFQDRYKPFTL